jgi:hypothetical protein
VLLFVGGAECALRAVAIEPLAGMIKKATVPPRSWRDMVSHERSYIEAARGPDTLFVFDPELGWTPTPNGVGQDGMSFISSEGLRAPRPDMSMRDEPADCKIAVLGDSLTFGSGAGFEDTWGYRVAARFGHEIEKQCVVLNFAVPMYSLGQMYLRYLRDVRPWRPDIVILGFTTDTTERTLDVYGFLLDPSWPNPWAHPRLVRRGELLLPINTPLPKPQTIFSTNAIQKLPYIEYDVHYRPREWDRPAWRLADQFFLFRLVANWHPRWDPPRVEVDELMLLTLNQAILESFVREAKSAGSSPVIVYLPYPEEIGTAAGQEPRGIQIARRSGVEFVDLTPCLAELASRDRFIGAGPNYHPNAVDHLAKCILPALTPRVRRAHVPIGERDPSS